MRSNLEAVATLVDIPLIILTAPVFCPYHLNILLLIPHAMLGRQHVLSRVPVLSPALPLAAGQVPQIPTVLQGDQWVTTLDIVLK